MPEAPPALRHPPPLPPATQPPLLLPLLLPTSSCPSLPCPQPFLPLPPTSPPNPTLQRPLPASAGTNPARRQPLHRVAGCRPSASPLLPLPQPPAGALAALAPPPRCKATYPHQVRRGSSVSQGADAEDGEVGTSGKSSRFSLRKHSRSFSLSVFDWLRDGGAESGARAEVRDARTTRRSTRSAICRSHS